jgi:pyruvate formate lyase activating enzyme
MNVGVRGSKPILETLLGLSKKPRIHLEISDLVFEKTDSSLRQTRTLCRWICRRIGADTPLHLVKFYPSYKMEEAPPASSDILEAHYNVATEAGLRYVYIANSPGHKRENTFCPNCGEVGIGRFGYSVQAWNLDRENRCKSCGQSIPILGSLTETPPEERYIPVLFPPMDLLYVCEGLSG